MSTRSLDSSKNLESENHSITRRQAFKLALASFGIFSLAEAHDTEIQDFKLEHKGENLTLLHTEVANQFAKELGEKLRAENNLVVTEFTIVMSNRDAKGSYSLSFTASFRKVRKGEKPDRHADRRGTILLDLKSVREENIRKVYHEYNDEKQNWLERLESELGTLSKIEISKTNSGNFFIEEWLVVTKGK